MPPDQGDSAADLVDKHLDLGPHPATPNDKGRGSDIRAPD